MKFKISKTLLFTSLAAVALLGVTQQVSAKMYTSRNFDLSGGSWSEYGLSSDEDKTEDRTKPPYEGLGTGYENSDWGGPGTVPTDPYTPPYEGALGTGYENSDWGGPGTVPTDPYTPPYEGLGTGYENSDWGGPGTVPTDPYTPPHEGLGTDYDKSPSIPSPQKTPWPKDNGFQFGPNIPSESDWGRAV
ncbi:streptococcal inhibitor of complement [Streptococcus dysgalactiae subsp. equisimilis]|uniref:Streptococcal inhibitor of complement n=1 Tax=Streptococcus dysgalactiae subsp. equisimilis TaxID=119602 RepID=A0A9X8T2Y1_STREQ|nr:hypothetical protein [Streptococcus dysgalactiae]SUN63545.1 streptococcal inhibitor of complement [Streptococcus dysgalactiae subsp. equisimilis]